MEPLQIIFIAIVLCILALGILEGLRRLPWLFWDRLPVDDVDDYDEWDDKGEGEREVVVPPIAATTTTPATSNNRIAMPQNGSNELLLRAKAESLAAMIHAGKIGQTEGIKLIFGVGPSSTNPRYQAARDATVAALQRLKADATYAELTPEQAQTRQWLTEE